MKNNVYPCEPQFYYIKVGFKGSKLYRHVFVMRARLLKQTEEGPSFRPRPNPGARLTVVQSNMEVAIEVITYNWVKNDVCSFPHKMYLVT